MLPHLQSPRPDKLSFEPMVLLGLCDIDLPLQCHSEFAVLRGLSLGLLLAVSLGLAIIGFAMAVSLGIYHVNWLGVCGFTRHLRPVQDTYRIRAPLSFCAPVGVVMETNR